MAKKKTDEDLPEEPWQHTQVEVTAIIKGVTKYSSSRHHDTPHTPNESEDDFAKRTYREFLHVDSQGQVFIPGAAFKFALLGAGSHLREKVPGKTGSEWTGYFRRGVQPVGDLMLGIKKDSEKIFCESVYCHANGNRTSGSRVTRYYPVIHEWGGQMRFMIYDGLLTQDIFTRYMHAAGIFNGVGRYAPRVGGNNGVFNLVDLKWKPM